jgi:hypothetical protein
MKYLVLTADCTSFLRDEFNNEFDYLNLNLPIALIEKLRVWYEDYLPIIQLDNEERLKMNTEIIGLDERGLELAKEIRGQLGDVKVKYFSEGLLRYIAY